MNNVAQAKPADNHADSNGYQQQVENLRDRL
jgi:hypothetical protein